VAADFPPLQILYEDGPVVAVNKPPGILTQGVPHGIPTLEAQVKAYLKERYHKPANVYLGVPHRLDRPVSGVIVFARNSKAARRLAEQFQERRVEKLYWGIVEERPDPPAARLVDWLVKDPDDPRVRVAGANAGSVAPVGDDGAAGESPRGKPPPRLAALAYRTLAVVHGGTLLEIELETGRTHQIRVQLASRGWPIAGDFLYGATRAVGPARSADPRSEPIALHARRLAFLHPIRYEPVVLTAPLPHVWEPLGISQPWRCRPE
jgi:23S rRNA pseudouridine1911/1915/1917 synthase